MKRRKYNSSSELPTNLHNRQDLIAKERSIKASHLERLPKLCDKYDLSHVYEAAQNCEISETEIDDIVYDTISDMATANMVSSCLKDLSRNLKQELGFKTVRFLGKF